MTYTNTKTESVAKGAKPMQAPELKPCPFCGGEAKTNCVNHIYDWLYEVRCPYCGCGTDYDEKEENAVKAWNRRESNG